MEKDRCPTEEYLCAYVEGSLSPEERAELEEHLTVCNRCMKIVSEMVHDARLLEGTNLEKAEKRVEEEVKELVDQKKKPAPVRAPGFWKRVKSIFGKTPQLVFTYRFATGVFILFVIATASVFLFEKLKTPHIPPRSMVRGKREGEKLRLLEPTGQIPFKEEIEFRWVPVENVDFYEVSLMDMETGKILLRDSTLIPRLIKKIKEIKLNSDRKYFWMLEAHLKDGRTITSNPVEFTLRGQ